MTATKRGRKPQPGSRTEHFAVRMSLAEIESLNESARASDETPAEFARKAIELRTRAINQKNIAC